MATPDPLSRRSVLLAAAAGTVAAVTGTRLASAEGSTPPPARMPVAFVGHGSPMLALDARKGAELSRWAGTFPKPKAVLSVSAHFERAPVTIGATVTSALVYDFHGFPAPLYEVLYPAPGAPDLAHRVAEVLQSLGTVHVDPRRGHDHGTWVPLRWMYPSADVPVLSLSLPSHDPRALLRIGRALRPLRDEGVLLLASGSLTHNLGRIAADDGAPTPRWARDFDAWVEVTLDRFDLDALLDWERRAPAARLNHPTVEHFVPLVLAAGARHDDDVTTHAITGFEHGSISRRSLVFARSRVGGT